MTMTMQPTLSDDTQRRALARQRALRAAAAVATTLFATQLPGCAVTVAQGPGNDADAAPTETDAGSVLTADTGTATTTDAGVVIAADAPPHPPADAHTVAMGDAGSVGDAPRDPCMACNDHLPQGDFPGCTSEYLQCLREASAQTGEECQWACAAWGPFVPPTMDA